MGRTQKPTPGGAVLLPADHDPRSLPDPIPASFYARGEAPPWNRWAAAAGGWLTTPRVLVMGAVALAAAVLIVGAFRLVDRQPAADRIALAPVPAHTPASSPPGQGGEATPFAVAPTATASPTPTASPSPTPTPTPMATPTATLTPVRITRSNVSARQATVSAVTESRTECSIAVGYSPPPDLQPMVSRGNGAVSWTWTVSQQVRPGIYQIQVTCGTGAAGATITVT